MLASGAQQVSTYRSSDQMHIIASISMNRAQAREMGMGTGMSDKLLFEFRGTYGGPGSRDEILRALKEALALVERGLATLNPERREVFVLFEIEGLSAPAIAELLGINVNTVYSRLARARRRFRTATAPHLARERGHHG